MIPLEYPDRLNVFSRSRYVKVTGVFPVYGGIETQNHLLPAPRAPHTHTTISALLEYRVGDAIENNVARES